MEKEMNNPFEKAERYIQLRNTYSPKSWGDVMIRINEMIITPWITIFFMLLNSIDLFTLIPSALSVYRAWSGWMEFQELRFLMQRMYLRTMQHGGPFIVTNDTDYLPYVYADAMIRLDTHHLGSA